MATLVGLFVPAAAAMRLGRRSVVSERTCEASVLPPTNMLQRVCRG